MTLVWIGGILTALLLVLLIIYVVMKGAPELSLDFLITAPQGGLDGEGGISTAIITTIYLTGLTMLILIPPGIGAAIYLTEYARDNWLTRVIRYGVSTLAGVPSIIFGLFGFAVFVTALHFKFSILSGALTLACLLLPTIISTTEEALKTVPRHHRAAALAPERPSVECVPHGLDRCGIRVQHKVLYHLLEHGDCRIPAGAVREGELAEAVEARVGLQLEDDGRFPGMQVDIYDLGRGDSHGVLPWR